MAGSTLTGSLGLGLIGFAFVSVYFIYRERSSRDELSDLDERYYRARDVRRTICSALMMVIGGLMVFGSQINVQADRSQVRLWTLTWLAVLGLLAVLLLLAGLDWAANHRFARRNRRELLLEQRKLLADLARERKRESSWQNSRKSPRFHDPSLN